jgi:hypothetical protein
MAKFLGFWRTRFAWFPKRMDDGRLVWLREFEEREITLASDYLGGAPVLVKMRRLPPERMIP